MTQTTPTQPSPNTRPDRDKVIDVIRKRSFLALATTSPADRPHVAGVLYEAVGTTLYVNTLRSSRKARNIAANPHIAATIPIRRVPVGLPSNVQFQGTAELLGNDHPEIEALLDAGRLTPITGHGELDNPDGCFIRITPNRQINTYGLGISLYRLIRDPLHA